MTKMEYIQAALEAGARGIEVIALASKIEEYCEGKITADLGKDGCVEIRGTLKPETGWVCPYSKEKASGGRPGSVVVRVPAEWPGSAETGLAALRAVYGGMADYGIKRVYVDHCLADEYSVDEVAAAAGMWAAKRSREKSKP